MKPLIAYFFWLSITYLGSVMISQQWSILNWHWTLIVCASLSTIAGGILAFCFYMLKGIEID